MPVQEGLRALVVQVLAVLGLPWVLVETVWLILEVVAVAEAELFLGLLLAFLMADMAATAAAAS